MAQAGIDPLRQSHATYDTSKPPRLNYKKIICNRFYFQEFHSSEEYYFHTEYQIQRISKFCPKIRSMTFMFERISCPIKGISILWFVYFFQLSLYRTYILYPILGSQMKRLRLVMVVEDGQKDVSSVEVTNHIKIEELKCLVR